MMEMGFTSVKKKKKELDYVPVKVVDMSGYLLTHNLTPLV